MPQFQNTNLQVFVGNAETVPTETSPKDFKTTGTDGEIKVLDAMGGDVTSSTKEVIFYSLINGDLKMSEPVKVEEIERLSAKAAVASQEIIDYVGFDGTSGSIDTVSNNLYQIVVEMKNYGGVSDELRYRKLASYQSDASGVTQFDVAQGITRSLIWNFKREPNQRIRFSVVGGTGSDVSLGTGVDNVVFSKGSRYISATDIDNSTTNAALTVGDLIRVGTTSTDALYRIDKIDSANNTAKLDREFTGEDVTIADTNLKRVPSGSINSLDYGVKFEGISQRYELGKFEYRTLEFAIDLIDFGSTDKVRAQAGNIGQGEGKTVADMEWFAQGNFGEIYRTGEPELYDYRSNLTADISVDYDVLSFNIAGKSRTAFQENLISRQIVVFAHSGSSHAAMNGIITDLNNLPSVSLSTL